MIDDIIKEDATYTFNKTNRTLNLRGTEISQLGDILADSLLLIPKKVKGIGYVSYGAYLQASRIYKILQDELLSLEELKISSHSLGAGIGQIVALLMYTKGGYQGSINLVGRGGIKVLSKGARDYLSHRYKSIIWRVNYRDLVPCLGWFLEPIHTTARTGLKKRHFLDYSIKAHSDY